MPPICERNTTFNDNKNLRKQHNTNRKTRDFTLRPSVDLIYQHFALTGVWFTYIVRHLLIQFVLDLIVCNI